MNRGGGSKSAPLLEKCYLGPNKAISIIELILANQSHGTMISYTMHYTNKSEGLMPLKYTKEVIRTTQLYTSIAIKPQSFFLLLVWLDVPILGETSDS